VTIKTTGRLGQAGVSRPRGCVGALPGGAVADEYPEGCARHGQKIRQVKLGGEPRFRGDRPGAGVPAGSPRGQA
jgi:hypothetical protein